jgi:hypothetical protein
LLNPLNREIIDFFKKDIRDGSFVLISSDIWTFLKAWYGADYKIEVQNSQIGQQLQEYTPSKHFSSLKKKGSNAQQLSNFRSFDISPHNNIASPPSENTVFQANCFEDDEK